MNTIAITGDAECKNTTNLIKRMFNNSNLFNEKKHNLSIEYDNLSLKSYDVAIILGDKFLSSDILNILNECSCILINSDIKGINKLLVSTHAKKIITFGLNCKSTVTASSISTDDYKKVAICIQREISTFGNKTIPQQEFSIKTKLDNIDVYSILSGVTTAILYDIPIEKINDIM